MGKWDSCYDGDEGLDGWDEQYKKRAEDNPEVAICKIWNGINDLSKPRSINDKDLMTIFGRIPGTQTPPAFKEDEWGKFLKWLNHSGKD